MTTVLVPTHLGQAVDALAADPGALVLAGGTDLMVEVNAGHRTVSSVISVRRVAELRQVAVDHAAGTLRLGAGVTYTRLLADDVAAAAPVIAQAARTVGSPQIRNAGTVGGNVGTASPAGDLLPGLVALGATAELIGPQGVRRLQVSEYFTGPKRTARQPGELIVAVEVPIVRGAQEYRKVGVRNAMVIAVASVALVVDLDQRTVQVGLGSVGPVPLSASDAAAYAGSQLTWSDGGVAPVDPEVSARFGDLVADAARPIDDHRSSAAYRRHAVRVLARRCLESCTAPRTAGTTS